MTTGAMPAWMPPVDIEETGDAYLVEMDLPGVRAEDINLELRDNNELRITGASARQPGGGTDEVIDADYTSG
jgi:HSP20 family protein